MKICILTSGLNIYARIYASKLIKFKPIIINEEGTKTSNSLSQWLDSSYGKKIKADFSSNDILSYEVQKIIKECDYAINGAVGKILKKDFLKLSKKYFLNAHPGLLPEFRGLDPVCWSLHYNKPLGSTLHIMEEAIDAGPILIRREAPIKYADNIKSLRIQMIEFSGEILSDYLANPSLYKPYKQDIKKIGYYSSFLDGNNEKIEISLKSQLDLRNKRAMARP